MGPTGISLGHGEYNKRSGKMDDEISRASALFLELNEYLKGGRARHIPMILDDLKLTTVKIKERNQVLDDMASMAIIEQEIPTEQCPEAFAATHTRVSKTIEL